jgi:uncharacterized membrane protein YqjE
MSTAGRGGGLFVSLRRLLGTVFELAQVRLELLLTEYEQEKLRIFGALLWAGIGLLLLGVGLVLSATLFVMLFPQEGRIVALAAVTLLFLGGGLGLLLAATKRLSAPGGNPLAETAAELARDRAGLVAENPRADDDPRR